MASNIFQSPRVDSQTLVDATPNVDARTSRVLDAIKALSESHRVLEILVVKAYDNSRASHLSLDQKLSILCLALFFVYCFVVYPLFICPTKDIPGLFFTSTAIGDQLYRCHKANDNANQWALSLHAKHGSVVRLTPTLVSVNDPSLLSHSLGANASLPAIAPKQQAQVSDLLNSVIKDLVEDLKIALRGQKTVDVHELLSRHLYEKAPASFATAVAHTIYQLSHPMHRHYLNRLVREIQSAEENEIESLRLLNAVVKESLRMQQGPNHHFVTFMVDEDGCELGKLTLEKGVVVTTSLYCVSRNPTIFNQPNDYGPLRWLEEQKSAEHALKFIVDYHRQIKPSFDDTLAHLKLLLATILKSFDMKLPLGEQPRQLDMVELRNGGCRVRFRERKPVVEKKVRFAAHVIM